MHSQCIVKIVVLWRCLQSYMRATRIIIKCRPTGQKLFIRGADLAHRPEFDAYELYRSFFSIGLACIRNYAPFSMLQQRTVNGPQFEAGIRPEPEITSPNPARARQLFLKPDVGPKVKCTERVIICATAGYQKHIRSYTFESHPKKKTLAQTSTNLAC